MDLDSRSKLFAYRDGFDYQSYLEQKSHFDRLELSVDKSISKLIYSTSELTKKGFNNISADLKNIDNNINSGFEQLSVEISKISENIDGLTTVLEYGISELSIRLSQIDNSLESLILLASTPDQTWAAEQFSIARDAFRKYLLSESLDFINKAISGYGNRSGYPLDHRYHMLRGLILLGANANTETLNLQSARDSFLNAAKYAKAVSPTDCARAYRMAGWASYCAGEMLDSKKFYLLSLEMNKDDTVSKFEICKPLIALGENNFAIEYFKKAITIDYSFAIRAACENDFLSIKDDITRTIQEVCSEYHCKIVNELDSISFAKDTKYLDIAKYVYPYLPKEVIEEFTYLCSLNNSNSLSELKNGLDIVTKVKEKFLDDRNKRLNYLNYEIKSKIYYPQSLKEKAKKMGVIVGVVSAVVISGVLFYILSINYFMRILIFAAVAVVAYAFYYYFIFTNFENEFLEEKNKLVKKRNFIMGQMKK
jgi:hypothetical protein